MPRLRTLDRTVPMELLLTSKKESEMRIIVILTVFLLTLFVVPAFAANYYLSAVVGSCTSQDPCEIRVNTILHDAIFVTNECYTDNVSNMGVQNWALVKVECTDPSYYQMLMNDPQIDMLPMVPFDMKMSAMASAAKNAMDAMMVKYGVTGNCDMEESCRLSIRCIGQQLVPSWTEAAWSYF